MRSYDWKNIQSIEAIAAYSFITYDSKQICNFLSENWTEQKGKRRKYAHEMSLGITLRYSVTVRPTKED